MGNAIVLTPGEQAFVEAARQEGVQLQPPSAPPAPSDQPLAPVTPTAQPSILQQIQQVLAPFAAGSAGPVGAAVGTLGELGLGFGQVLWNLFNRHSGQTTVHPTLAAAQQAALKQLETLHAGCVDDPANPTTVEITPVIHIGVPDVQKAKAAAIPTEASSQ